ncbi:MAG: ATP-binding protein [Actinomycetota bacterium]|nr:ATP-binding protein [Actinomycetota bacterium]
MTDDSGTAPWEVVTLSVPARRHFIAGVRSLTTAVAAQYGLTVDAIEDLQMAVDEACALLLPQASGDSAQLETHFDLEERRLRVEVSVAAAEGAEPDREGLSWTVLSAVADGLEVARVGERLCISFAKRREVMAR